MYVPSEEKSKQLKINQITNNSPKRQFFRTSLRSREDLGFLKYRQQAHRKDMKVRDTIGKPDFTKYISQTSKNDDQVGRYFKNKEPKEKSYTSNGIKNNRSLDKKLTKNQNSPMAGQSFEKKFLRENIKPEGNQYQKLHDKLNFLEGKIAEMKTNLEKKREEKKRYFQKQHQQKKQREQKDHIKAVIPKQKKEKEGKDKRWKQTLKDLVTQVPHHKQLKSFDFNPYSPRHNTYYVSEIVRAYKEEKSLAREHLINSMHLLKMLGRARLPSGEELASRFSSLDKKHGQIKTVIFDLDETLIHCNENISMSYDIKLPIKFPTGEIIEAGINIRPYAREILKNLAKNFQIIVFTASHSCYANVVLNYLDPENRYISHRLFREHCYPTAQGIYVKDLRVINRDLSKTVLVDNAAYSYAFQVENGIPIIPYYEGKNDYQLKALQGYLENNILFTKDVRETNKNTFKIHRYVDFDTPEALVKELYGQGIR